jgi:ribosomal protein S18 acetylase RimI-like enzyme
MATVHQLSRRAVTGDLPAILRIDHLAASGDRERAEFIQHCVGLGECRVYVTGEVVAGFVVVQPAHFFGRDFVELLIVDPARRRSGVGRILLREAVASAGTARVFTSTNASNRPMRALLASEDWSFSGGLGGLDEGDPELVFYQNRPAGPGPRAD